eukprot:Platyproteum_vivax@DN14571_c0_g1_i1.p1
MRHGCMFLIEMKDDTKLMNAVCAIDAWQTAKFNAEKTGKLLAGLITSGAFKYRPVNLIGYSLGAEVMHTCLKELADQVKTVRPPATEKVPVVGGLLRSMSNRLSSSPKYEDTNNEDPTQAHLVNNVIFVAGAVPNGAKNWENCFDTVHGHCLNLFTSKDQVLNVVFRGAQAGAKAIGLTPIEVSLRNVHNLDFSDRISSHGNWLDEDSGGLVGKRIEAFIAAIPTSPGPLLN